MFKMKTLTQAISKKEKLIVNINIIVFNLINVVNPNINFRKKKNYLIKCCIFSAEKEADISRKWDSYA